MSLRRGYFMVLAAGALWGSIGLFSTALTGMGMTPVLVAFLRLFCALLFLIPMILLTKGTAGFRIDRSGFLYCVILGVFAQALFNIAYTKAISEAGMAIGAVLLYTSPVFGCIISRIVLKESMGPAKISALLVNIAGCILAVTGGGFDSHGISAIGVLCGLASGFLYSLLAVIGKISTSKYDPMTVLFYVLLTGSVFLALIARPWTALTPFISGPMILCALGFGMIPTCFAMICYMGGLSFGLEASRVPVIASVETISAALLGAAFLGQAITVSRAAGIVIIMISIMMINHSDADPHVTPQLQHQ